MAQMKTYSFTSAASPANVDINVGFDAAKVELYNFTGQGSTANPGVVQQAFWTDTMAQASAICVKNTNSAATLTSSAITSAGISMIADTAASYGSTITAFTNANPAVITVSDASGAGFAVGDTIQISEMAYSGAGTNPNQTYVIASISGNALTTTENSTSYGVYVSGGSCFRISDSTGAAVANVNRAQRKVRIGTGVQTASSVTHIVIYGKNCVV